VPRDIGFPKSKRKASSSYTVYTVDLQAKQLNKEVCSKYTPNTKDWNTVCTLVKKGPGSPRQKRKKGPRQGEEMMETVTHVTSSWDEGRFHKGKGV
jgi:hypothetical protein